SPPAPGSLSASKDSISWAGAKGHLIVGYRIYHSSGDGGYKLIGHTVKPSYSTPSSKGSYHIKAVNYFGRESEPSKTFKVEVAGKDNEKEKDKRKNDKKEKEKAAKEKQKAKEQKRKAEEKKRKAEEKKRKEEEKKQKESEKRQKEEEKKQKEEKKQQKKQKPEEQKKSENDDED